MRMYFDLQLLQFQTKIVSVKYSIVVCAVVLPGVVAKCELARVCTIGAYSLASVFKNS